MKAQYAAECRAIEDNSKYTAEAHHTLARWDRVLAYALQIVPAVIAAVSSALVAGGVAGASLLWATVVSAAVSAIAAVVDFNKAAQGHLSAAKAFTTLKNDARFLRDAEVGAMSDEEFARAVRDLHARYNTVAEAAPPTTKWAFKFAQRAIAGGIHAPDAPAPQSH